MFNCIEWIFSVFDEMRKKDNKKYKVVWVVGDEDILDIPSII